MKKIICQLFLLSFSFTSFTLVKSQTISITVLDKESKLAIENASVMVLGLNGGTITNSEGSATFSAKSNTDIKISMINYEERIVKFDELTKTGIIYLVPKIFKLDEVTVNSFDFSKSLTYVIENYSKLYDDQPFNKHCDFKEIVEIDGELKRLIIAKVNWWDKSYQRKRTEPKFRLAEISFYKNMPFDIFPEATLKNQPSKSGFLVLNSVVNTIYLNVLLNGMIPLIKEADITVEESPADVIIISFETNPLSFKDPTAKFKGKFTFDKKSRAILRITYEIAHQNDTEKKLIHETKEEYLIETIKSVISLDFYKTSNNKFSLKNYEVGVNGSITYGQKIYDAHFVNKIYVLGETHLKKVNNNGLIDMSKPIYESLPSKEIKNANGIVLNSREKQFMFGGK